MAITETVTASPQKWHIYYSYSDSGISQYNDDASRVAVSRDIFSGITYSSIHYSACSFRLLPEGRYYGYSAAITLSVSETFGSMFAFSVAVLRAPAASYKYADLSSCPVIASNITGGSVTLPAEYVSDALSYGMAVIPDASISYGGDGTLWLDVAGTVTYNNFAPPSVAAVSPVSATVLAENENVFTWSYSHPSGIPQTGYELHIVRNSVDTVIASGTGSYTSAVVPADTLVTGTAQWYVVVTAEADGETLTAQSEPVYVIVRSNPSTSDVTADNMPHLTVSWTAHSQQAAQIRVGDTVYPTVWTDEGSYTIPEILSDGVYPVSVRTQTTEGDWSGWSEEIYADIKNVPPTGVEPPELTYTVAGTTASLIWTAVTGAEAYVLYRSGVPIYAGDGTAFVDARVSGLAEYKVRALLTGGGYIESAPQTLIIIPGADTLVYSDGGVPRELPIRHHPQYPARRWDESADVEFNNYAGRTLPVAVYDGHVSRGLTLTAAYRSPQEAASLLSLLGKTVTYKSKKGDVCRGVIVSASRDSSLTDAVTYRITATDDDERAYLT